MTPTRAFRASALLGAVMLAACGGSDGDNTPTAVLSRFLDAMDRSTSSDDGLADAYALLDTAAKHDLHARAEQASLISGRDYQPWQMLAQGRFRLRFAPADHGGMRANVDGDSAVVHVVSSDKTARADVPMVREQGQWRVLLTLPELHRVETEPARVP